jgi:hypothetical protein
MPLTRVPLSFSLDQLDLHPPPTSYPLQCCCITFPSCTTITIRRCSLSMSRVSCDGMITRTTMFCVVLPYFLGPPVRAYQDQANLEDTCGPGCDWMDCRVDLDADNLSSVCVPTLSLQSSLAIMQFFISCQRKHLVTLDESTSVEGIKEFIFETEGTLNLSPPLPRTSLRSDGTVLISRRTNGDCRDACTGS